MLGVVLLLECVEQHQNGGIAVPRGCGEALTTLLLQSFAAVLSGFPRRKWKIGRRDRLGLNKFNLDLQKTTEFPRFFRKTLEGFPHLLPPGSDLPLSPCCRQSAQGTSSAQGRGRRAGLL